MSTENGFLPEHHVYIKCRFKSSARNLYGLSLIAFNPSGTIESYHVIVSSFSDIYQIDQEAGWSDYEGLIVQTKWGGKYNQSVTRDLQLQIESGLEDSFQRAHLFEAATEYDYGTVEQIMFDAVKRIIQDKNLKLEIGLQEVTEEDIAQIKEKRETERLLKYAKQEERIPSDLFQLDEGAVVLPATLILSPVKGKQLSEIRLGDKIMVKIDSTTPNGQHYIDHYNLREESVIRPLPAQVIDIKAASRTDPLQLLLMVEQGVYCKCTEEERQVKLRMYDPATDRPIQELKRNSRLKQQAPITPAAQYAESSNITVILSVALAMVLLVLIVVLYLIL